MKFSRKEFFSQIWNLFLGMGAALYMKGTNLAFQASTKKDRRIP
jgi:hypothetical protein